MLKSIISVALPKVVNANGAQPAAAGTNASNSSPTASHGFHFGRRHGGSQASTAGAFSRGRGAAVWGSRCRPMKVM